MEKTLSKDLKVREREMSKGILRQRRNLMAVSILLPLYLISGANVEKVSILGTVISIENSNIITISLILLFTYFLLRYYQYFNEESHVKNAKENLKKYQNLYITRYFIRKAKNKLNYPHENNELFGYIFPKVFGLNSDYYHGIRKNEVIKVNLFKRQFRALVSLYSNSSFMQRKGDDFLKEREEITQYLINSSDWVNCITEKNDEIIEHLYESKIEVNVILIQLAKLRGFINFILTNSLFTDYYLPLITSFATVIVLFIYGFKYM